MKRLLLVLVSVFVVLTSISIVSASACTQACEDDCAAQRKECSDACNALEDWKARTPCRNDCTERLWSKCTDPCKAKCGSDEDDTVQIDWEAEEAAILAEEEAERAAEEKAREEADAKAKKLLEDAKDLISELAAAETEAERGEDLGCYLPMSLDDSCSYLSPYVDIYENCLEIFMPFWEEYYECRRDAREAKIKIAQEEEKARQEEEKKLKLELIEGSRIEFKKLKLSRGQAKMLRGKEVLEIDTTLDELIDGDVIHTEEQLEIATGESVVRLGKNTTVEFVGLPFDPVPDRRIVPPKEAPWAPDQSSFRHEVVGEKEFWRAVYDDAKEHGKAVLSSCIADLAGVPNPLDPSVPVPIKGYECFKSPIVYLADGSLWSKKKTERLETSKPTYEWVMTKDLLITHMSTEFAVEVIDGSTTLTVLEGSVLVIDLETGESEVITENKTLDTSGQVAASEPMEEWWEQKSPTWIVVYVLAVFFALPLFLIVYFIIFMVKLVKRTCPKCKAHLPFFSRPKGFKQSMTGNRNCPKCKTEVDWKGRLASENKHPVLSVFLRMMLWFVAICTIFFGMIFMIPMKGDVQLPETTLMGWLIALIGVVLLPPVIDKIRKKR